MVCPVATSSGSTAKRAARARASRLGPGSTVTVLASKWAPNLGCGGRHDVGFVRRSGTQAMVDVDGGHVASGGGGEDQERERVRAPRDRAGEWRPRGGRCSGSGGRRQRFDRYVSVSVQSPALSAESSGPRPPSSTGPGHPQRRVAELLERREPLGPLPHPGLSSGPPDSSTDSTKCSPSAYWRILASSPSNFDMSLVRPWPASGAAPRPGRSARRPAPRRRRRGSSSRRHGPRAGSSSR